MPDVECELCWGLGTYSMVVVDDDSGTWDEYNAPCECLEGERKAEDSNPNRVSDPTG